MKILAAIITHNRRFLLERCIDRVRTQTRPPDHLLVVNNGSTDGTVEMLKNKEADFITQANVGSAGGWKRAMEEALIAEADAVWLMDDDGYPEADALELLESQLGPNIACISSVVVREDEPNRFVFPFPRLNARGLPVLFARSRKFNDIEELSRHTTGEIYPFAHLFNGALIPTHVLRKIGVVNSDFFLMGDEVDYFMRMRGVGTVGSYLRARHLHPDVSKRRWDRAKVYYFVKNSIILNHRHFDQPFARDCMNIVGALLRTARRNSLKEAAGYVAGPNALVLWQAVARGLRGRVGPDYRG
jgi:GT2 family glycosyltransferase